MVFSGYANTTRWVFQDSIYSNLCLGYCTCLHLSNLNTLIRISAAYLEHRAECKNLYKYHLWKPPSLSGFDKTQGVPCCTYSLSLFIYMQDHYRKKKSSNDLELIRWACWHSKPYENKCKGKWLSSAINSRNSTHNLTLTLRHRKSSTSTAPNTFSFRLYLLDLLDKHIWNPTASNESRLNLHLCNVGFDFDDSHVDVSMN